MGLLKAVAIIVKTETESTRLTLEALKKSAFGEEVQHGVRKLLLEIISSGLPDAVLGMAVMYTEASSWLEETVKDCAWSGAQEAVEEAEQLGLMSPAAEMMVKKLGLDEEDGHGPVMSGRETEPFDVKGVDVAYVDGKLRVSTNGKRRRSDVLEWDEV